MHGSPPIAGLAAGGPAPLGPPKEMLEYSFGPGRRYDPHRDVLTFFPPMLYGVARTLNERAIPVLVELENNRGLDADLMQGVIDLLQLAKDAKFAELETYQDFVEKWASSRPPEATDLLLKLLGRAVLQFYVESAIIRQLPDEEKYTCDTATAIDRLLSLHPSVVRRLSWRSRLTWWAKSRVAALFGSFYRRSSSSSSSSPADAGSPTT